MLVSCAEWQRSDCASKRTYLTNRFQESPLNLKMLDSDVIYFVPVRMTDTPGQITILDMNRDDIQVTKV